MKALWIVLALSAFSAFAHEDADLNVRTRDANVIKPKHSKDKYINDDMRKAIGSDVVNKVVLIQGPEGRERIEGKCESKTKDTISITIPCRNIELILKNGDNHVETADLDPRGGFYFEKLSPNLIYTMFVRKKTSTHSVRMDGMRTGRFYSFSIDD